MRRAFERAHKQPLRLHRPRQGARRSRRCRRKRSAARRDFPSGRGKPVERRASSTPMRRPRRVPPRATRFFSQGAWREGERLFARGAAGRRERRRPGADHRAASDDRRRTGLARRRSRRKTMSLMPRVEPLPRREAIGVEGRSGDARNLQQPLHVDRRADGRDAAEHRLFGQHQGAARLFLRGVRPPGPPRRQRAAYAGASGLDGPLGRDDHPRQRRAHPPGRRVRAQRAL